MPGVNRKPYILNQTCRLEPQVSLSMISIKNSIKNSIFLLYNKTANNINIHKCKKQNIPIGYLLAQYLHLKL